MANLIAVPDLTIDTFERLYQTGSQAAGQLYNAYQRSRYDIKSPADRAPSNGLNVFYKAVTSVNAIQWGNASSLAHLIENTFASTGSTRGYIPALRYIRP